LSPTHFHPPDSADIFGFYSYSLKIGLMGEYEIIFLIKGLSTDQLPLFKTKN